jgi:SAM-dependent methyltransferase/uncharacterized protein YbaR (Trm112 family)
MAPFPLTLICPRCRKPGPDGNLVISILQAVPDSRGSFGAYLCPLCRTSYDVVDEIPCIPNDEESFRSLQANALACDWICEDLLSAQAACRVAGQLNVESLAFCETANLALHALAHFPGNTEWLRSELECNRVLPHLASDWFVKHRIAAAESGVPAIEVGCGPGVLLHKLGPVFPGGIAGMDWRIGVLRLARRIANGCEIFLPFCAEGRRFEPVRIMAPARPAASLFFVQGDILAPPLEAEAFSAVIALSLLDTVADPIFALGQLDALLAPGGLLLVGTPYSWSHRVTDPKHWWSGPDQKAEEVLRDALGGRNRVLPHFRYEILEESSRVPWAIPGFDRLVYRFFLDVVLARKA